jgi:hypothetical protein
MVKAMMVYIFFAVFFLTETVYGADKVVVIPLHSARATGVTSSDFYYRTDDIAISNTDVYITAQVSCDPGDIVTGGGFSISGTFPDIEKMFIYNSSAYTDNSGWAVSAINHGGSGLALEVNITCANVAR